MCMVLIVLSVFILISKVQFHYCKLCFCVVIDFCFKQNVFGQVIAVEWAILSIYIHMFFYLDIKDNSCSA